MCYSVTQTSIQKWHIPKKQSLDMKTQSNNMKFSFGRLLSDWIVIFGLGSGQNSQYLVGLAPFGFLSLKNPIFDYKIFDHQEILSRTIKSKQKNLYKSKCFYKTKSTVFQAPSWALLSDWISEIVVVDTRACYLGRHRRSIKPEYRKENLVW